MKVAPKYQIAIGTCLCLAGFLMVLALCFEARKRSLSGVPANHIAVHENGRYYFVPRGGGASDQRPQTAITAEQFEAWKANADVAMLLACGGVALGFVAAGIYLHRIWQRNTLPAN